MIKINRGKKSEISQVDATALIYVSSANEKYAEFVKDVKKHPYRLYEFYTGKKLPLWKKIYLDTICRFKKTDYEKQQNAIDKAIKPYIRKVK